MIKHGIKSSSESGPVPIGEIDLEKAILGQPSLDLQSQQKNRTSSFKAQLAAVTSRGDRKNEGTLNDQIEIEAQRKREEKMKKVLAREMSERYDRTFMSKDTRKQLK